ncbi:hypothetical protein NUW58_g10508 [Xylaria curta]|uniref:Uncharacterized protein n=1 Tax=Xylaria curta TaxID=42375 RepID=A0ACC1MKI0_9PEZI|nr:hypothetical protein NUW58_g10508 [Xylaria curta]
MKALSVSHKGLSFKDKMALVSARWSEHQKLAKAKATTGAATGSPVPDLKRLPDSRGVINKARLLFTTALILEDILVYSALKAVLIVGKRVEVKGNEPVAISVAQASSGDVSDETRAVKETGVDFDTNDGGSK